MPEFSTEIRNSGFNKEYLKVFIRDKSKFESVQAFLSNLPSVKNVNITKNTETDLTIYPSKLYSVQETEQELKFALNNFFSSRPVDPVFEENALSGISDKAYNQILDKIFHFGQNLEKYKDLYEKFDEEGFRNFFLPYLNSISPKHTATGETFNKIGKTDILIQDQNGLNVFIAECKLWHGESELLKAVDQLLERYVTWRDEKVALIIFNKSVRKFGDIVEKAVESMKSHTNFSYYVGKRDSTSFSYFFTHPDDPRKKISLELIMFNCI